YEAGQKGIEGQVYVEYSVMPDGRSRMPRVIYAVPGGLFEQAARESLLRSKFPPGAAGEPPVPCTLFYRFYQQSRSMSDYPALRTFVQKTQREAEAGDPNAQMLYGMLLVGLPQLNKPRSQAMPWFLKAAQAGVPVAQFQIGFSLMKGWG